MKSFFKAPVIAKTATYSKMSMLFNNNPFKVNHT